MTSQPKNSKKITIVVADDHHIVRRALLSLLEMNKEFSVIGDAADGLEAVNLTRKLNPDVLLVDLMMPGINGLEVTRQIIDSNLRTAVVILSMYEDVAHVVEAYRIGAKAYVLKNSMTANMTHAICEAAAGRIYVSPPLTLSDIQSFIRKSAETAFDIYEILTTREREVLHLIAEGNTNSSVASRLGISVRTVEAHRANFMKKLGLRTQVDVYRFAVQRGILS
jgi:Response regulator containing a CheY-like receiver domain and an HTH DNA-binding domain